MSAPSLQSRSWTIRSPGWAWLACAWAYGSVAGAAYLCERTGSWALYAVAVFFIAARQHTLYVLNHDAGHGNLFRGARANHWFATALCNWPFLHHPEAFSFVLWRRVHHLHHAKLFSADDPNFVGRRERGDTAAPLSRARLLRSVLAAPFEAVRNFFFGRQDYARAEESWGGARLGHQRLLWLPVKGDRELEMERRGKLVFFTLAGTALWLGGGAPLVLKYWLVPMYTVYPAILRLMDLSEHNWSVTSGRLAEQANSRRASLAARLFLSDLSRELHWEHHLTPAVPFHRLRAYSRALREEAAGAPALLRGFTSPGL